MPVRFEAMTDGTSRDDTGTLASDRAREIDEHDGLIVSIGDDRNVER
jgi:hypothetical protein